MYVSTYPRFGGGDHIGAIWRVYETNADRSGSGRQGRDAGPVPHGQEESQRLNRCHKRENRTILSLRCEVSPNITRQNVELCQG